MAVNLGTLPQPDALKFTEWASVVTEQLSGYGVPNPPDEILWRDWACSFSDAGIPGLGLDPYGFGSWQDWASALIGTLT